MFPTPVPGMRWAASAPGRVCLAGEDLDWLGGSSIQAAIALRVDFECLWDRSPTDFALYAEGELAGQVLARDVWSVPDNHWGWIASRFVQAGIDPQSSCWPSRVNVRSRLPAGAGLASSAALAVAVAQARAPHASDGEIVECADRLERGDARRSVGPMDFLPCAIGGVVRADFEAEAIHSIERMRWPKGVSLVVVDTGVPRDTSRVIDWKRHRRAAEDEGIDRYALLTRAIVDELSTALTAQEPDALAVGRLVNRAHATMRDDLAVSNPLIENCVGIALNQGALGAKITGTGLGGCVVAVAWADDAQRISTAFNDLPVRAVAVNLDWFGSRSGTSESAV